MNGYGNWLHVPRNLYIWTIRDDSISSIKNTNHNLTYNANFDIALEKSKTSNYESIYCYNSSYKEFNSMMFFGINPSYRSISIISPNIDSHQKQKIKEVYVDKIVKFNEYTGCDYYVVILNYFYDVGVLLDLIKKLKSMNNKMDINMYYLNDCKYLDPDRRGLDMRDTIIKYENILRSEFIFLNYFYYIRHLNFKIHYANQH